jgi:hypothetical protein
MNDIPVLLIPILSTFPYNDIAGPLTQLSVNILTIPIEANSYDENDDEIDEFKETF